MIVRPLAQILLNGLCRRQRFGVRELLVRLVYKSARTILTAIDDPLITYRFLGQDLAIPVSHDLPIIRARYPEYGLQLGRIARYVREKYPALVAVDIGANVGDSVAILRNAGRFPILCIEPDKHYAQILAANTAADPDVSIARVMLDEFSAEARGNLVEDHGTARFNRAESASAVPTLSLPDLLRQFPSFGRPKLIKVDTDGMDARILSGATEFLAETRPILFFEYDPHLASLSESHLRPLLSQFAQIGYRMALVYQNDGDLVGSWDLRDSGRLDDLDEYYSGRRGKQYADICAFHESDLDVWADAQNGERKHYRSTRLVHGDDGPRDTVSQ